MVSPGPIFKRYPTRQGEGVLKTIKDIIVGLFLNIKCDENRKCLHITGPINGGNVQVLRIDGNLTE